MGMPPFSVSVPTSATLSYRYRNLSLFLPLTQDLKACDHDADHDIDKNGFAVGRPGVRIVPAHVPISVMFDVSGTSRFIWSLRFVVQAAGLACFRAGHLHSH